MERLERDAALRYYDEALEERTLMGLRCCEDLDPEVSPPRIGTCLALAPLRTDRRATRMTRRQRRSCSWWSTWGACPTRSPSASPSVWPSGSRGLCHRGHPRPGADGAEVHQLSGTSTRREPLRQRGRLGGDRAVHGTRHGYLRSRDPRVHRAQAEAPRRGDLSPHRPRARGRGRTRRGQAAKRRSGLIAALAVEGSMVAADHPDTRSWTTLPAQVFMARETRRPTRGEVILSGESGQRRASMR